MSAIGRMPIPRFTTTHKPPFPPAFQLQTLIHVRFRRKFACERPVLSAVNLPEERLGLVESSPTALKPENVHCRRSPGFGSVPSKGLERIGR